MPSKKKKKKNTTSRKYATSVLFISPDPKDLPIPKFKEDGSMTFVQETTSTNGQITSFDRNQTSFVRNSLRK